MQEKQKKAIRWISPVLIALTALIVWRVNYEIEFMMDDEWYSTVLYADTPIRNLSDIIRAQIWHYFNWGGRSMAHALLQLILLAGEHWADILNTGMTLLLGWLACMIADRRKLPYWFAALGMDPGAECQLENEYVLGSRSSELSVYGGFSAGIFVLLPEI